MWSAPVTLDSADRSRLDEARLCMGSGLMSISEALRTCIVCLSLVVGVFKMGRAAETATGYNIGKPLTITTLYIRESKIKTESKLTSKSWKPPNLLNKDLKPLNQGGNRQKSPNTSDYSIPTTHESYNMETFSKQPFHFIPPPAPTLPGLTGCLTPHRAPRRPAPRRAADGLDLAAAEVLGDGGGGGAAVDLGDPGGKEQWMKMGRCWDVEQFSVLGGRDLGNLFPC